MADEPNKTGLSEQDQKRIIDKLNTKWHGSRECPICKTNQWTLVPNVSTPMQLAGLQGGVMIGGGNVYPTAMLICTNCGYTLNFNLVVLGIIPAAPEPTPEKGPPNVG